MNNARLLLLQKLLVIYWPRWWNAGMVLSEKCSVNYKTFTVTQPERRNAAIFELVWAFNQRRGKVICVPVALPASTSANTPAKGNQRFHLRTTHMRRYIYCSRKNILMISQPVQELLCWQTNTQTHTTENNPPHYTVSYSWVVVIMMYANNVSVVPQTDTHYWKQSTSLHC